MQQNIKNSAMTNGLIVGGLLSVKFVLSANKIGFLTSIAFIVSVLAVFALFYFAKRFRDTECGGVISYGQSFKYIFLVYFYGSIVSSLVILLYTNFINTDFLASMLNDVLKMYDAIKMPIDDQTYDIVEMIYKPAPFALFNVFASIFGAAFWALILAAFVKKDKSIFE